MSVSISTHRFTLYHMFLGLFQIPGAVGQHDCDRYCFASCEEYFNNRGRAFSACVIANDQCNCWFRISHRNLLMYFVLSVLALILLKVCEICCRAACRRKRNRSHTIAAHPILTGNIAHHRIVPQPVISNMAGSAAHIIPGNGLHPSTSLAYPASRFVIPTEGRRPRGQQSKHELPSEYLPPPDYNTCMQNVNENEMESSYKQHY